MRTLALGLLVAAFTLSASAQTRTCTSPLAISVGTIGVGVAVGALAGRVAYERDGSSVATLLLAEGGYAVGIGVGAPLVGAALGCQGSPTGERGAGVSLHLGL